MKIADIAESVVAFPTKDRQRSVQMDRLRKRSSYYNDKGEPTDKHPDLRPKEPHLKLVKDSEKFPSVKTQSVGAIAYKHNVTVKSIRQQLTKGIKAELEHTTDKLVAKEIALDHLAEHPDYYDRLEKMEEAGGVGTITSQNTTADVKPGETGRQANKFNLNVDSAGTPKLLKTGVKETFSDSRLRNNPGANRNRAVSGSASPDPAEIQQIIRDEDYDEMFHSYGPMFVNDDATKRYGREKALAIISYLKGH